MLKRLEGLKLMREISFLLAEFMRAESYKLDEAMAIDSLTLMFRHEENFMRLFFKIEGDQLPPLLAKILKVLGPGCEIE